MDDGRWTMDDGRSPDIIPRRRGPGYSLLSSIVRAEQERQSTEANNPLHRLGGEQQRMVKRSAIFALGLVCAVPAGAEVKLNRLFTPGAVLQQGMPLPVWGPAREGERVTVELDGKKASATAKSGKWMVKLPAMRA